MPRENIFSIPLFPLLWHQKAGISLSKVRYNWQNKKGSDSRSSQTGFLKRKILKANVTTLFLMWNSGKRVYSHIHITSQINTECTGINKQCVYWSLLSSRDSTNEPLLSNGGHCRMQTHCLLVCPYIMKDIQLSLYSYIQTPS